MTVTHQDLIEANFPIFLGTFSPNTSEMLFVSYASHKQCWSKLRSGAKPDRAGPSDLFLFFLYTERQETSGVPHPVLCCHMVPSSDQ